MRTIFQKKGVRAKKCLKRAKKGKIFEKLGEWEIECWKAHLTFVKYKSAECHSTCQKFTTVYWFKAD